MSDEQYIPLQEEVELAANEAKELAETIQRVGSEVGWASLEAGLEAYESHTGGAADELLPAEATQLGLTGRERAREFARKILCNRDDEVRVSVETARVAGVPALIAELYFLLDVPPVAMPIVVALAGIILARGFTDLCGSASEDDHNDSVP